MNEVLLVSDQPMPNFLPILNRELKPDKVTLVVSSKMRPRAEWLKTEIVKHQVEILPDIEIGDNTSDIHAIENSLMGWVNTNEPLFSESILNVTGGTKPMAIAAQEVFRMGDRPVFYVDIATDTAMWVNGDKQNVALSNQPNLTQFLGLHGITMTSGDFKSIVEDEKWRHFYSEIASDPRKWALSIRALNRLASQAEENKTLDLAVSASDLALPWLDGNGQNASQ